MIQRYCMLLHLFCVVVNKILMNTVDLRLHVPFSLLVAGSSGAGKSNIAYRLLASGDKVCTEQFSSIYWCYAKNTKQPDLWAKLQKSIKNIKFIGTFFPFSIRFSSSPLRFRRLSQQTNRKRRVKFRPKETCRNYLR